MVVQVLDPIEDLAFNREDFVYEQSWKKFLSGKRLREFDFIRYDDYIKYFLLDLELVDFATVVITGQRGSGKSLFMVWLASKLRELFGKGVTFNFHPKEGDFEDQTGFGKYDFITEKTFLDEWVKLTDLADRKDKSNLVNNLKKLTEYSQFYNRTIGVDEARKWASKYRSNGRMLQYIGELVDLSRHNHNVILFSMPNALNMLNRDTILDNRTHVVRCGFNTVYMGCATYTIQHENSHKLRQLHLSAKKYSYLWETHNLIGMSRPITAKQMKDAQSRASGDFNRFKEN